MTRGIQAFAEVNRHLPRNPRVPEAIGSQGDDMAMTAQVQVQGGAILGVAGADGAVIHFLGIPFAAPPIAGLRWRPPEPVTPWQGVLETLHAAPAGPQPLPPPPGSFYQKEFFRTSGDRARIAFTSTYGPPRARPTRSCP